MMYLYIALGVILLVLGIAVVVPVRVVADYAKGNLQLMIRVLGIEFDAGRFAKTGKDKKSKSHSKEAESADGEQGILDKIDVARRQVARIKHVYDKSHRFAVKHIFVDNIYANVCFGTWDAAITGMVTGAIWALLYEVLGLLTTAAMVNNHKFDVDAVYDRSFFDITAGAVIKFRIAGIAGVAMYILYNMKKYKE